MTQEQLDRIREAVADKVYEILTESEGPCEFEINDAANLANGAADELIHILRRVVRKSES